MPLEVTSKISCNRKYCNFTVTSTLTYILLSTGVQGLLVTLYKDTLIRIKNSKYKQQLNK